MQCSQGSRNLGERAIAISVGFACSLCLGSLGAGKAARGKSAPAELARQQHPKQPPRQPPLCAAAPPAAHCHSAMKQCRVHSHSMQLGCLDQICRQRQRQRTVQSSALRGKACSPCCLAHVGACVRGTLLQVQAPRTLAGARGGPTAPAQDDRGGTCQQRSAASLKAPSDFLAATSRPLNQDRSRGLKPTEAASRPRYRPRAILQGTLHRLIPA